MTASEIAEFLTGRALIARIGTISPDGWPAVNPVWFEYENGAFYIVTKELTGFCQNLTRDPRAVLCIDSPEPPYRRLILRGRAQFMEENWIERGRRGVLRYLGPDGLRYFEATIKFPRQVIRIVPERFSTWNGAGPDRTFAQQTKWHDVEPGQLLGSVLR
jgi:nitroimidazol reductase NimA-like FMN-containing flavoprotein (pyridoxamine 5'-phosphate oxidase superfamily)